jgi:hypothetical protein
MSTVGRCRAEAVVSFEAPNRLTLRIDRAELARTLTDSVLVWERVGGK